MHHSSYTVHVALPQYCAIFLLNQQSALISTLPQMLFYVIWIKLFSFLLKRRTSIFLFQVSLISSFYQSVPRCLYRSDPCTDLIFVYFSRNQWIYRITPHISTCASIWACIYVPGIGTCIVMMNTFKFCEDVYFYTKLPH